MPDGSTTLTSEAEQEAFTAGYVAALADLDGDNAAEASKNAARLYADPERAAALALAARSAA